MKKFKILSVMAMLKLYVLATSAFALDASVINTKVNNEVLSPYSSAATVNPLTFDRGDKLDISVRFKANEDASNVMISAEFEGYEYADKVKTYDTTSTFDIKNNTEYVKKLSLTLPENLEQDQYWIRLEIKDRNTQEVQENYLLNIETSRHKLDIKDTYFSPENRVIAGRGLISTVKIKNYGEKTEDDVVVRVSIPELGISATDTISEIEAESTKNSEEMYMKIPSCTTPGVYKVVSKVEYNEGYDEIENNYNIEVLGSDACEVVDTTTSTQVEAKPTIQVSAQSVELTAGNGGAFFPVTITNPSSEAKTFSIVATGNDWVNVEVKEPTVVVGAKETKTVQVYVTAKDDAPEGKQTVASLTVKQGSEILADGIALNSNIVKKTSSLNKTLQYGLIVLIILIVIIGLIIAFNRLKDNDEDEDDISGQTYY